MAFVANLAEIFGGLAAIVGFGFGFLEYRRHRVAERREAAASLARSFQTQELAAAIRTVPKLPQPLDRGRYEQLSEPDENLVWVLSCSMESIAILVFRGDLALSLVDEFFLHPGDRRLEKARHLRGRIARGRARITGLGVE